MSAIPLRVIGGTPVPAIGFGIMGISVSYGAPGPDAERLKVLDAAYESGSRFWDTADVYGDSEDVIGKWISLNPEKRKDIFLATKFGFTMTGGQGDADYVRKQCETSLKRLNVEYIDLYYQHRVDPKVPIETTVAALVELVKEGKIKQIGLSDCTADGLRRAHAVHPISALQIEFSPIHLDVERAPLNLVSTARELGIKIIAYAPLGRGILTGQVKSIADLEESDFRHTLPKYQGDNFPKLLDLAGKIEQVGKKHNATAGQTVLAWILAQGDDFFVIPGTKKVKYVAENSGAAKVTLTEEEVAEVRKLAEDAEVTRLGQYGPGLDHISYVDSPLP